MNGMLFSRILAKTGVGNHINMLSNALQKQGHHVVVCSGTEDLALQNEHVVFVKVDTLSRNPIKVWKSILHLRRVIHENAIDVVHCHHRVAAIYMKIYNLFFKIPYVYSLHLANVPCDFFHRACTFIGGRAIGVSQEVCEFMVEKLRIPKHKVVNVVNGVDESELYPLSYEERCEQKRTWDIPDNKYVIAMHSRIDKVKNHLLLVEALHQLNDTVKGKLVVVCSGEKGGQYYEAVKGKLEQYGLTEMFRFVGWTDTRKILGIADFLVAPSKNEGFMLSAVEAFMLKVPVARTETAGFKDQKYCIPIDGEDPTDMVTILRQLCCMGKEQYEQRIQAAYDFAMKDFTAVAMARKTVAVYQEVCCHE